jgi:hypothetical protein
MDYDYDLYCEVMTALVHNADIDFVEYLEIGVNISPVAEVKVIFDGFGDREEDENGEYVEGGNLDMQSFAVFIHRNTIKGEEFPEHEFTPWGLIHRPREEFCTYVWYDAINGEYEVLPLEDRLSTDEGTMSVEEVMEAVRYIKENYFSDENN